MYITLILMLLSSTKVILFLRQTLYLTLCFAVCLNSELYCGQISIIKIVIIS